MSIWGLRGLERRLMVLLSEPWSLLLANIVKWRELCRHAATEPLPPWSRVLEHSERSLAYPVATSF